MFFSVNSTDLLNVWSLPAPQNCALTSHQGGGQKAFGEESVVLWTREGVENVLTSLQDLGWCPGLGGRGLSGDSKQAGADICQESSLPESGLLNSCQLFLSR